MRGSRRWHAVILVGAVLTAAVLLAPAGGSQASTSTNSNACLSSATATYSEIGVTVNGTDSPDPVTVGTPVLLKDVTMQASFPAALFVAGYRLGLLTVGANSVAGTLQGQIKASNTSEGQYTSPQVAQNVTVTIIDPTPATKTNGDESALPLDVTLSLPNTTWTPTGGSISFTQGTLDVAYSIKGVINGSLGPCNPASALTGCDGTGGNCTGYTPNNSPTPFAQTTVNAGPPPTTQAPTTTTVASTTTAAQTTTTSGQATTTTGAGATTTTGAGATTTTGAGATTTTAAGSTTTTAAQTTTTAAQTTTTSGQATTTTTGGATTTTVAGGGTISGSATYTTECQNNVTTDKSNIAFTAAGTIPAAVQTGTPFALSKQQWSVTVPGSVLQTGINLGLLQVGQQISGTVDVKVTASNTLEGSRTATAIPLSITVQRTDVTVSFPVPDMSFTPAGGTIDIRFASAKLAVSIPPLDAVQFTCNATSTGVIVSVSATGQPIPTTTSPATTTTVVTTTTVASGTGTLPETGPRQLLGQLILAAVLLDLGYLALSALRPPRRRPAG